MKPMQPLSEQAMQALEAHIPLMAQDAFTHAYLNALTQGGKVLRAQNGKLVEMNADGSARFIREIEPPIKVEMGAKRIRKSAAK